MAFSAGIIYVAEIANFDTEIEIRHLAIENTIAGIVCVEAGQIICRETSGFKIAANSSSDT